MPPRDRPRAASIALLVLLAWLIGVACGGDGSAAPRNAIANGGFEDGEAPWIALAGGEKFRLTEAQAHTGATSALLSMDDPPGRTGTKIYYLVQEITPAQLPQTLSGFYRVEGWQPGSRFQYLQFVVIVFGADNFPATSDNWQIRYLLAGTGTEPLTIGNGKFKFFSRAAPVQDEWVPFETDLREDFQQLWGMVPEGIDKIRLLFEVRWDGRAASDGPAAADVYYDDLYAGPPRSR